MILVMPMAGRGARLAGRGAPKPLVHVAGQPMVTWALAGLASIPRRKTIFVVLDEHEREFGLSVLLREAAGSAVEVISLSAVTDGQLCTVLEARSEIRSGEDVLVASCDTFVESDLASDIERRGVDTRGIISVASLPGDRWSFARTNEDGKVVEVTEKVRISPHASTGLYYFADGSEFLDAADTLVRQGRKTRGEYYVMPVYGEFISRGWDVRLSHARSVLDMGTPEAIVAATQRLSGTGPDDK
jgi:NDP-sugar pyrophosphorylase family protein